jgi:hypothetical protein
MKLTTYDTLATDIEAGLERTYNQDQRDETRQEAWVLVMTLIRAGRQPDVAACVRRAAKTAAQARALVPRVRLPRDRHLNGLELAPPLPESDE